MASKSLNLKYSKNNFGFFSKIALINADILGSKNSHLLQFTQEHEFEIGRGKSYAVFPELENYVVQDGQVTLASFRKALADRGVSDVGFQNKILCLILQNKSGVHYPLANILNDLFRTQGYFLIMNQENRKLALEIDGKNQVTLVFKATWEECHNDSEDREPAIEVDLQVIITPNRVEIGKFNVNRISESPVAVSAFNFFEENQQNILEKIISAIKHFFGFTNELRLEETDSNDFSWASATNLRG